MKKTAWIWAIPLVLTACDGYADLPLPLRELGPLRIEQVSHFTEGPGLVQIALDPPSDAVGPFVIVGHPAAVSQGAAVLAWAFGPCQGSVAPDPALRLCLAVVFGRGGTVAPPLAIALVVESRAEGRRFTLSGVETAPAVP